VYEHLANFAPKYKLRRRMQPLTDRRQKILQFKRNPDAIRIVDEAGVELTSEQLDAELEHIEVRYVCCCVQRLRVRAVAAASPAELLCGAPSAPHCVGCIAVYCADCPRAWRRLRCRCGAAGDGCVSTPRRACSHGLSPMHPDSLLRRPRTALIHMCDACVRVARGWHSRARAWVVRDTRHLPCGGSPCSLPVPSPPLPAAAARIARALLACIHTLRVSAARGIPPQLRRHRAHHSRVALLRVSRSRRSPPSWCFACCACCRAWCWCLATAVGEGVRGGVGAAALRCACDVPLCASLSTRSAPPPPPPPPVCVDVTGPYTPSRAGVLCVTVAGGDRHGNGTDRRDQRRRRQEDPLRGPHGRAALAGQRLHKGSACLVLR
jgi:hypothetical protein